MPHKRPQATCHPLEPHYAHGLCSACFHRQRYESSRPADSQVKEVRAACHTDRPHYSAGLCYECFSVQRPAVKKRNIKRMADCHPDRPHYSKGLCQQCYDADKHKTKYPEQREHKIALQRAWYGDNKAHVFARELKRKFNITIDQYNAILKVQDGACGLCGAKPVDDSGGFFHVDHDHLCCSGKKSCGKCVRGLLCRTCNAGLGQFYDSIELLLKAVAYLKARMWVNALGQTRNPINEPDNARIKT
jgi:hypothetical protein